MNRSRVAFGILLILAGALWAMEALQWWEAGSAVARWWPLAFLAFGGIRLLDRPPDYVGGVAMMLIGIVVLDGTANVWPGSAAELIWPLILVGIGLTLLVHRRQPNLWSGEDVMQLTAVFSGRRAVCSADPFRGAVAVAIFGGVDLDLRPAVVGPEGAFVDATAAFGGVKLIVPPEWRVVMTGPAIFGGNENKTELLGPLPRTAPVLNVRALALFGGVEVQAQQARASAPEMAAVGGGTAQEEPR